MNRAARFGNSIKRCHAIPNRRCRAGGLLRKPRRTRYCFITLAPSFSPCLSPCWRSALNLDPSRYEVVIIDGRLEADAEQSRSRAARGVPCVWESTGSTGAPISGCVANIARGEAGAAGTAGGMGRLGIRRCSGRECLAESAVDVTVQGAGRGRRSRRSSSGSPKGRDLDDCAGCTVKLGGRLDRDNPAPTVLAPIIASALTTTT